MDSRTPETTSFKKIRSGWTGLEREAAFAVAQPSEGFRELTASLQAEETADTPPIRSPLDHSLDHSDPVAVAVARALTAAAAAGRFDVVAQLARELEARRLAGSNVVPIGESPRRSR
jgi:hypothetical protein